ncbi:hypothetical protein BC628DRAFT_144128 [Trametes gibbosa]|nr:hypothetical protein BC628DRAFT_144128 [Trametes gibbosa]
MTDADIDADINNRELSLRPTLCTSSRSGTNQWRGAEYSARPSRAAEGSRLEGSVDEFRQGRAGSSDSNMARSVSLLTASAPRKDIPPPTKYYYYYYYGLQYALCEPARLSTKQPRRSRTGAPPARVGAMPTTYLPFCGTHAPHRLAPQKTVDAHSALCLPLPSPIMGETGSQRDIPRLGVLTPTARPAPARVRGYEVRTATRPSGRRYHLHLASGHRDQLRIEGVLAHMCAATARWLAAPHRLLRRDQGPATAGIVLRPSPSLCRLSLSPSAPRDENGSGSGNGGRSAPTRTPRTSGEIRECNTARVPSSHPSSKPGREPAQDTARGALRPNPPPPRPGRVVPARYFLSRSADDRNMNDIVIEASGVIGAQPLHSCTPCLSQSAGCCCTPPPPPPPSGASRRARASPPRGRRMRSILADSVSTCSPQPASPASPEGADGEGAAGARRDPRAEAEKPAAASRRGLRGCLRRVLGDC